MFTINLIRRIQSMAEMSSSIRRSKTYRRRTDPFKMPEEQFKARYRFNKSTVKKIILMVKPEIELDRRGCGTSVDLQVLVALRYWGRREIQDDSADLHGLSQATVCRISTRVARALARWSNRKIKMPLSLIEEEQIMRDFKSIKNFPGVIGAIDGTHIRIKKTGGETAQYYINRKGYYSLNVQVVCDSKLKIRDIVAKWRGSTHDSRIFNESAIKQRFESGEFKGRLLGDSGYKLQNYLFTPLSRPQNEKEQNYNAAQICTRNPVERCFGVWKQRFRFLLDGLTVSLEHGKTLIVALAVLHNDTAPDDCTIEHVEEIEVRRNATLNTQTEGRGAAIALKTFIQKHF